MMYIPVSQDFVFVFLPYCFIISHLRHRLASGEGIVSLDVRLSRCHAVCVSARISLGSEGNAPYPVLSSFFL